MGKKNSLSIVTCYQGNRFYIFKKIHYDLVLETVWDAIFSFLVTVVPFGA